MKRKRVREAREIFDRAPSPTTSVCNALLSGYAEHGYLKDAEDLFGRMQTPDLVSWNAMITGYTRAGMMQVAQRLFDEMPEKDTVSWTAIVRGYLQNGDVDAAWKVFQDMPDRDVLAWNTMMSGFVVSERLDDALRLFADMPDRDLVSWNTILQGYIQQGDMDGATAWFRKMPEKDEASWNTLISGYKDEGALNLLSEMTREGYRPDQATWSVAISICSSLAALGCGRMVHVCTIKTGFERDALVMSSLISMYSKCGLITEASQVFDLIVQRDTVTWNAMIATYAYHGLAAEALTLFDRMTKDGFSPDHATFLSVLSACAHKGYLYEGCHHFRSMQQDWNLIPRSDHYSCMVDLLGRSGFVHQAYNFTRRIPSDLQINAWETLFSSCNAHGDIQLGELVAKNVLQSRPSDGGMYTLLSNIYAAKGMWSSAASVRGLMKEQGLKKETGCSWIELKGDVVSFSSNDKAHPLIEQICQEVGNLSNLIEEAS
jgi:pentatricopeptide repeat protein